MTPPSHRPAGEGAPGPADQRCREIGVQVVMRFAATLRIGRTYTPDNHVFKQQIDGLLETLAPLLDDPGEAVLVSLEEDLYLNGVRIPVRKNSIKFQNSALEEFRRRGIAGLRLQAGIKPAELHAFFRLFLQPEVYAGPELLAACLAQGLDHVAPAIHASTEAPEDDFEYDSSLQWVGEAFGSDAAAGDGAVSTGGSGSSGGGGYGGKGSAPRGAARKNYSQAIQGARSLLTTTTLRSGLELRHGKRVVQPLVDGAFADEPVVVGLSSLTHKDEYTYAHAVNVCLVAVTMGKLLEMDRRALADLGVAALLHDVGKSAVVDLIHHPLESFTDEERAAAERHPVEGAILLAHTTTLNQTTLRCMRVALEHHILPDGSGYPKFEGRWPQSVMSRLVAVADCYVSLLGHRSERGAVTTPYDALGLMLGPLRKRFDAAMLWALVQTVGYYPPGQLVLLDDGSTAAVLAPNAADLARPHVRVVISITGDPVPQDHPIEYRPLPKELSIVRPLKAVEYPAAPETDAAA